MKIKRDEVLLKNDLSEIRKIKNLVETFGEKNFLSKNEIFDANLALEEIVVNIISHGYEKSEVRWIKIDIFIAGGKLILKTEDDGKGFDPTEAPKADFEQSLEKRTIGGWGIHIVKNIVDEVEYQRKNNKNIFTMKKNIKNTR